MTPEYFMDHLPSIITALGTLWIGYQQIRGQIIRKQGQQEIVIIVRGIQNDLQNGVGDRIVSQAVERLAPTLQDAALKAADQIAISADIAKTELVDTAYKVAVVLKADQRKIDIGPPGGVERRKN